MKRFTVKFNLCLILCSLCLIPSVVLAQNSVNSSDDLTSTKKKPIDFYSNEQKQNSFAGCAKLFPENNPDNIINFYAHVDDKWQFRKLCSDDFAVLYSVRTKTPVLVIEKFDAKKLENKEQGLERKDNFYADPRLPKDIQSKLSDYSNVANIDRGHLAPAVNAMTVNGMNQTFALSNIFPQNSANNRGAWKKVESDVRRYIGTSQGTTYIVSGIIFDQQENSVKIGKNNVWKPSRMFKLVYNTAENKSWVYLVENQAKQTTQIMTYNDFSKQTGVKFGMFEGDVLKQTEKESVFQLIIQLIQAFLSKILC